MHRFLSVFRRMASHEAKSARTRVQEVLAATPNELKDMERSYKTESDGLSFFSQSWPLIIERKSRWMISSVSFWLVLVANITQRLGNAHITVRHLPQRRLPQSLISVMNFSWVGAPLIGAPLSSDGRLMWWVRSTLYPIWLNIKHKAVNGTVLVST